MTDSIALGRYVPRQTFLHRLDPRIKIIALIVAMVGVFLDYGTARQNYLMYGLFFLILSLLMLSGHISSRSILR
ncbi:MAG: hypothetical protein LKJ88_03835, partial [Bacilli bacterium]|nr:hypothetical protein [Bacilli bacterium]